MQAPDAGGGNQWQSSKQESMDMRRNEIGFGIWTAYLGEVKFKAHQKVQFHCRLGWVGFSAKGILF